MAALSRCQRQPDHVAGRELIEPRVTAPMGRAQAIVIDPATGVMVGGTDARGEGAAAGW